MTLAPTTPSLSLTRTIAMFVSGLACLGVHVATAVWYPDREWASWVLPWSLMLMCLVPVAIGVESK